MAGPWLWNKVCRDKKKWALSDGGGLIKKHAVQKCGDSDFDAMNAIMHSTQWIVGVFTNDPMSLCSRPIFRSPDVKSAHFQDHPIH